MNQVEEMQTFKRIVEAGSISKAADQLDTVKSAVSRRLVAVEKRLNVKLLQRTTRRQTLTEAGQRYYQQCLRLLDDIAEAEALVANIDAGLTGQLKISAPVSFGLTCLGPALLAFQKSHPQLELSIDFNDKFVDLIAEGFDLAIRIGTLEDSSLIAKKLSTSRLVICASPSYLKQYGTPKTPHDLLINHHILHYRSPTEVWQFIENKATFSLQLPGRLTANNGNFLCDAAIAGQGIIYTPDFICYDAIKRGALTSLLNNFLHNNILGIFAVYPQTRYLPKRSQILIEFLQDFFEEDAPWLSITSV